MSSTTVFQTLVKRGGQQLSSKVLNGSRAFAAAKGQGFLSLTSPNPRAAYQSRTYASFERKLVNLNLGGIGHVDHGKTTLAAAITKHLASTGNAEFLSYDSIDKAPEERNRGITINSAHVEFWTNKYHVSYVDCPGHRDYIRNMISSSSKLDAAVVIVAATDGVMTQTKEHLMLSRQLGIKDLVVYVNKVDMVDDPEMLELVEMEIRELLTSYGFDGEGTPIIMGSALCALEDKQPEIGVKSIEKLLSVIDEHIPEPVRDMEKPFMMPVEGVFSIPGRGTVATGRVDRGILKKGDEIEIVGYYDKPMKSTVTGVEMFKKDLDQAQSGDNCGLLLRGVKREDLKKGQVIAVPGTVKAHKKILTSCYCLTEEDGGRNKPFGAYYRPQMFVSGSDVTAILTFPEGTEEGKLVYPGDACELVMDLDKPTALEEGTKFTLREGNRSVVTGFVTRVME